MFLNIEREKIQLGHRYIAGLDEAGSGPLAGPCVAAAVIIPQELWDQPEIMEAWDDSKKISPKKRQKLYEEITSQTIWAVASSTAAEIDRLNIRQAVYLAMERAVNNLAIKPDLLLGDAWHLDFWQGEQMAIVSGDARVKSIAAASILAKVHRDNLMVELDQEYPDYGFARHKGYPTKAHYQAIFEHGICPQHRQKVIRTLNKHRNDR